MKALGDPRLEAAIRAVEAWRERDIGVTPLSADADERRFLVEAGAEPFVLRLGSPSSARPLASLVHEVDMMRAAAAAGVAPEVTAFVPQLGCLVTRSAPGRRLTPSDADAPGVLASLVGSVRALHTCPLPDAERSVFRDADELRRAALARGVSMPKTEPAAAEAMRGIEAASGSRTRRSVACHGNLTLSKVLLDDEQVWIVDYRRAGAGDPFEDLGSLAAHLGLTDEGSVTMLRLYFGTVDDQARRDLALARVAADYLAAMRSLARPAVVTNMQTVEGRLAGVAAAAAEAGVP